MIRHIFPNFLQDEGIYRQTEQYWIDLWQKIDSSLREANGWRHPWFEPLPPSISEGNPIFSAVSPSLRRGVRILQYEPKEKGLEFFAYPDTFGGSIYEAQTIHELVISCALSDVAASLSRSLILPWVSGKAISFDLQEGGLVTSNARTFEMSYDDQTYPYAA